MIAASLALPAGWRLATPDGLVTYLAWALSAMPDWQGGAALVAVVGRLVLSSSKFQLA